MEAAGSQREAETGWSSEMARVMEQASNCVSQDSDRIAGPAAAWGRAGVESGPSDSFDCIGEIFAGPAKSHAYRFARKPANKARITPAREFIPDEEALFEQIEENPMFLQESLRRAG
jgi:hypothetical protein